ncbi:MAG TPA: DUF3592 domain-containing protein [Hydrogenophaga sp.]|uniref:DUF3592 domain-containing protein n=1 Tax=Hydrogenophaga sp. TaxID=1904254 RepID=UPI002C98C747|nr:DUF3592 domain-containing protein [Hydrogenophaga sp.]HSX95718.1 DUF3592 domain-containing protein [Hydrogenophaga sp.]
MKPLLLFLVIAIISAWFFGSDELDTYARESKISVAPRYATGVVSETLKSESRRGLRSFRVRYQFMVDGKQYFSTTTETDEQGAASYVLSGPTLIAYDARDPRTNTLKQYYDHRQRRQPLWQALVIVGILSVAIALPTSLLLSWRFGWFKRRPR